MFETCLCLSVFFCAISLPIALVCMNTVWLRGEQFTLWTLILLLKILTILLQWVNKMCYYVVLSFKGLDFCYPWRLTFGLWCWQISGSSFLWMMLWRNLDWVLMVVLFTAWSILFPRLCLTVQLICFSLFPLFTHVSFLLF